ncbi:MAG: hypothetical protein Q7J06_00065, partial [Bacteroidales bacterium]|nr:hypothetical protein [Bacteroidales bacterium]
RDFSLLISGEYTYGVRSKGILSYRLPSNVQFELNYTKYDKDQKAINYNYLEERKVAVSVPIRGSNFAVFSRLTLNQMNFYRSDSSLAARTLSEADGYFSYLGLAPGEYFVRIDTVQLRKLSMTSEPESRQFNIAAGIDGDIVDGLDFTVKMKTREPVVAPERKVSGKGL